MKIVTTIFCTLVFQLICSPSKAVADDKTLVAYWSFDGKEKLTCLDSSGHGNHAKIGKAKLEKVAGHWGNALRFPNRHFLQVGKLPALEGTKQITFAAWVKPTGFDKYNEIFRKEDGNQRVLFSFQESGKILSLGLNINGYVECDAPINPSDLLSGQWHHCAGTFDGKVMRVYLDGKQIASQNRVGNIKAGGQAPGCIGSANGGECFLGTMDDLRIYSEALTQREIEQLYASGQGAVKEFLAKQEAKLLALRKRLAEINFNGKTFEEALASAKKSMNEKKIPLDGPLAADVLKLLQTRFPADFHTFGRISGLKPSQYLFAHRNLAHMKRAQLLIEPLSEFMPLTKNQWSRQSPADRMKWQKISALQDELERLNKLGDKSTTEQWVALLRRAEDSKGFAPERPHQHEPVAPYLKPATPETKDLTADVADAELEQDWLYQINNQASPTNIKNEIVYARQIAARIKVDCKNELTELEDLEKHAAKLKGNDPELYLRVRRLKREITFKNPALDFEKVVFVDMPFPGGREWQHETRHRLGYMAVPGARLQVLKGLSPHGHLRQLAPSEPLHGSFWRPDVSFDGKRILFCFKPHNEKAFHVYEINADGTNLRQVTDSIYDDLDPIYLPDGKHIMFSTTRGHTYVRCMPPTNAYPLARCDLDGKNVYIISRNNEPDYLPSVMNDGRVVYTRWEYTDKPLWRAQGLWTVNPDGTQVDVFWGNQSVWPDLLKDARSIPGSDRVMFTGSAHHNWFSGSVGIIDPDRGSNFPEGLTKVTAELAWPESGNGPSDPIESPTYHASGKFSAYYSPYPISENDFLVSANRGGKFVLYLMDIDGNRELIYEGTNNILHAMPLKARKQPPILPDRVTWPTKQQAATPENGVIFSNNVYEGLPKKMHGMARHMRILTIEAKTYTYWYKRPYISTGPVVSGVQSEGVKRVLGTVPIEKDGSLSFSAPSGIPLHFQLLDEEYRALQTMRSFTGVMPGERRGCVGCHESRSSASQNFNPSALARKPSTITPPPWGEDTVSFERYVRPVLTKYCGECHEGEGKARKVVDLSPRPGKLGFDQTYWFLTGNPSWGKAYKKPTNPPPGFGSAGIMMVEGYGTRDPAAYQTQKPMTSLSYKSPLIELVSSGKHYNVKVDPISRRKLIAWVDSMGPYRGDKEVRAIEDPVFQGVEWLSIRPKIKTAPRIRRPGPVE